MAKILDGKKLALEIQQRLKSEIDQGLIKAGRAPGLAVIRVGNDPASGVYVSNKTRACEKIGVKSFSIQLDEKSSTEEIISKIADLNDDLRIDGILVQLPLPSHINSSKILKSILPTKDADGLHAYNLGSLLKGEPGPRSCTPAGIMALLASSNIELDGTRAVVIGRSILVGKPMGLMLQAANSTVTVAHSHTKDLSKLTNEADVLVVAAGKPQMIGKEHVSENTVVIDVGIHRIPQEKSLVNGSLYSLCGDVRTEEVFSKARAITPVPGGVGPMTVSMLLVNTVFRWQDHCGLPFTLADLLP
tara:strand:+ start:266 stop:1174 length:909 start_codon:yes stop_codon:yes gene_type:complete